MAASSTAKVPAWDHICTAVTHRDGGPQVQLLQGSFQLDIHVSPFGYLFLLFLAPPKATPEHAPKHPAACPDACQAVYVGSMLVGVRYSAASSLDLCAVKRCSCKEIALVPAHMTANTKRAMAW